MLSISLACLNELAYFVVFEYERLATNVFFRQGIITSIIPEIIGVRDLSVVGDMRAFSICHMRIQGKGGCLQTSKSIFPQN